MTSDPAGRPRRAFYLGFALVTLAIPLIGFGRTFGAPVLRGEVAPPLRLVVHASCFFAWVALLTAQVALARAGRLRWHKRLGWFGAALAALVVASGLDLSLASSARDLAQGRGEAASFLLRLFLDMALFGGLAAAALALRRDREAHGRLMLLATAALMGAAGARVPVLSDHPHAFMALLVGSVAAHDLLTRGRLHLATLLGGLAVMFAQVAAEPLGQLPVWIAAAEEILGAT